jgi:hypothetical protein
MASIVDDYLSTYNNIVDPIISRKKSYCDDVNETDLNYSCHNIYIISQTDINLFFNDNKINLEDYKGNIRDSASNFLNDRRIEDSQINKNTQYYFIIDREIDFYTKIDKNYKTIIKIIETIKYITILYLLYIYFVIPLFMEGIDENLDYKKVINNLKNKSKLKSTVLDGGTLISICYLMFETINSYFKQEHDINENKIKKLYELNNSDGAITKLKNLIQGFSTSLINPGNLYSFITNFKKVNKENLTNNNYSKNNKIKKMNEFFTEMKHIILINDNKFNDILNDNHSQIICLMKLLIHQNQDSMSQNEIDNKNCSIGIDEGFKGLLKYNKMDDNDNGIKSTFYEDGNDDFIDIVSNFYKKIKTEVIDTSYKNTLDNNEVFKTICNIFIVRIKYYNLKKIDFIKYIYKYFSYHKEEEGKLSKLEIINNYKSLINIIYERYNLWSNINNQKEYLVSNIISKSRFIQIMNKYETTDIKNLIEKLDKTIDDIQDYKHIYREDILDDIKKKHNHDTRLKKLFYVVFISSILQLIGFLTTGYVLPPNNANITPKQKEKTTKIVLKNLTLISILLFFNILLFSNWFKSSANTSFERATILDSNNKFLDKLHELYNGLKFLKDVKSDKIISDTRDTRSKLISEYSIYTNNNENNKEIYYKKNSDNNYTLLDKSDVNNFVIEDLYLKMSDILRLHACCSFLKEQDKKVVLPYHEIVTNFLLILVTITVIFYLISDPSINPFDIFSRLITNKKIRDRKIKKILEEKTKQKGGEPGNAESLPSLETNSTMNTFTAKSVEPSKLLELNNRSNLDPPLVDPPSNNEINIDDSALYVLYITAIFLFNKFTTTLVTSNIEYEKSLYQ